MSGKDSTMQRDICLASAPTHVSARRSARTPRLVVALGLFALLLGLIAAGDAPQPRSIDTAAPGAYEDWHGNVRRSR
jgi:hypothetical protein